MVANVCKAFGKKACAVLAVFVLQGCATVAVNSANLVDEAFHREEQAEELVSVQEHVPREAILIDGVPYLKEQAEELVVLWNQVSNKASLDFQTEFSTSFNAYTNYLSGLTVMPSSETREAADFLERLSASTAGFCTDLSSIKSLLMTQLETSRIPDGSPYEAVTAGQSDVIFQYPPFIAVEGHIYPASVISIIQEEMAKTSKAQWALLSGNLERTLIQMYSIRKRNSEDFSKWVWNWPNFFTKPGKELLGIWENEYVTQYNVRINKGVDTELFKQQITLCKDKAEILFSGYMNALISGRIPVNGANETETVVQRRMVYGEVFAPYTLLQNVYTVGELFGLDVSAWRGEINNRIGGAIDIAFKIADIVGIIASKFNPIVVIIEVGVEAGKGIHYGITKDKKAANLQTEIEAALDNELSQLLTALRCIS
jgi:hypothetical protein